ncbi:putative cytochrome P450 monooxygenase SirB-like protein [Aspergillus heteromorphus CBS 117.55]|uniref:Putative cytochrome P450 monooxygenase SirB-like protein n=1 Tax=Aspergillus heteromorphus CBS 117.55 TaxID=1448321 RepID=A0A317VZJ6_9EURO|nr:putative cytochrome P450 monooxygenase SirB-like protein [Aspergillus heteromorphus CBS 117.55]PWY79673.1 putative cytochrome P450 monooxygenase SirB-like protein [Aspergillus heteromorphus CBS 117.55]
MDLPELFVSLSNIPAWYALLIVIAALFLVNSTPSDCLDIPAVKYGRLLPNFVNRRLFYVVGHVQIQKGYDKYKNLPFRILKPDGDLIVLPARYLDEVRQMSPKKLGLVDNEFKNVLGECTVDSGLAAQAMAQMNPVLDYIIPRVVAELQHAITVELPSCKDWTPINLYTTVLRLVSRSVSCITVGDVICRDEQWLDVVASYTTNMDLAMTTLRPFPSFLRPIVARFLPSVQRLKHQFHWVQHELLIPVIQSRRYAEFNDPYFRKHEDLIQWTMDLAGNALDRDPALIARDLMTVTSLTMVRSSAVLLTQALYDLIARPEYLEPLRKEIRETFRDGWKNVKQGSLRGQHLLDSFLRESCRWNPSQEINVHRIVKRPLMFSDGLAIPKGAHICFATGPISRDPAIVPGVDEFNGFRWYKSPSANPDLGLHFGFDRGAYPGRVVAVNTAKLIMSRLLQGYEFEFEGRGRPANVRTGEQILPDTTVRVVMRERNGTNK